MHSSNNFGLAPLVFPLPFKNRIKLSIWYLFAVQYAVTLGNRSRSAFPNLAASRRAVGSLIRVYCEYTSRPLSSSGPSSPKSGLGRSFSFCAFLVVLWGPILGTGGFVIGTRGDPWLFLRRSLLLSAESICGCDEAELAVAGVTEGSCCASRLVEPVPPSIEIIAGFGLNVTFRDAFF